MADSSALKSFADVDIDEGIFKYILIKLIDTNSNAWKYIVRGYKWASFHADILDTLTPSFESMGLRVECIGGGRIRHDENEILGFGMADHAITVEKLKSAFAGYKISFSNEGY